MVWYGMVRRHRLLVHGAIDSAIAVFFFAQEFMTSTATYYTTYCTGCSCQLGLVVFQETHTFLAKYFLKISIFKEYLHFVKNLLITY